MSLEDTPGSGCGGAGQESAICDCLSCNIERIASATESIAASLARKSENECDKLDKCIDHIIEKINEKLKGPVYTCEQCRDMVRRGLGGTLEYAVRCAGAACKDCVDTCQSEGEAINEGKCCTNCGSENCTCVDGECVPAGEKEEDDKKKFRGWCNRETKLVIVTEIDAPPPGIGYEAVSLASTEQSAYQQAEQICSRKIVQPQQVDPIPTVFGGEPTCDVFSYANGEAFQRLNAQAVAANLAEGPSRVWRAAGQLGFEGLNVGNLAEVAYGIFQSYTGFSSFIVSDTVVQLTNALGCNNVQLQQSIQAMCAISNTAKYWGFDPTPWMTPYIYAANAVCRQHTVTPQTAVSAYLANRMTIQEVDAIFGIHGVCSQAAEWTIQTERSKPVPLELMRLRRRTIIDKRGYDDGMRQLGYLDEGVAENLYKLSEVVPTQSEIIRFMVRDADDVALVDRFGLDTGFDSKYGDQLKEWSEYQGVSEIHARYNWRAHWDIPSPTQLFEFWRRLRNRPEFGGKAKLEQDIRDALIQQDILPYWHEHYLAVQYRPMRLVDIRRSFQIGSMKDDELEPQYLQLGFSDENAKQMADFTRRLRDRAVLSERPVKLWLRLAITRQEAIEQLSKTEIPLDVINDALNQAEPDFIKSPYARSFARGEITAQEMREALSAYGVSAAAMGKIIAILGINRKSPAIVEQFEVGLIDKDSAGFAMIADGVDSRVANRTLDRVESSVRASFLKRCQAGIKSRYLLGELDKQEAANELIDRGTVVSRANQMVDWWGCELKSGEKHVSGATLCDWLARGAISSADFLKRLRLIGYSDDDSAMMLDDCLIKISAKRLAEAKKEAKEQAAEQSRIQRILQQQAKQTERLLAQQQTATRRAAETKQRREKSLVAAAEKITPQCECDLYAALELVRNERSRLQQSYGLSIDQSLQVLTLAAAEYTGPGLSEFVTLSSTIAEAIVAENISGEPTPVYIPGNTNGETVPS